MELISNETYEYLLGKQKRRLTTMNEDRMVEKYVLTKMYKLVDQSKYLDVLKIHELGLDKKINRLFNYLDFRESEVYHEIDIKTEKEMYGMIDKLFGYYGFRSLYEFLITGESDEFITTEIINDVNFKYVRKIFLKNNDCGQLRGKSSKLNVATLLSKMCRWIFGFNIEVRKSIQKMKNNSKKYYSMIKISREEGQHKFMDYFVIFFCRKKFQNGISLQKIKKIIKSFEGETFKLSTIHGCNGFYVDYIRNKYISDLPVSKCAFIDDMNL